MIRLLYFSRAVPTLTGGDIKEILAAARRKNREKDITGALVSGGDVFLQILEGPTEAVLSLYLRIAKDKRHTHVGIMRVTPMLNRLFGNWSMDFLEATPLQFEQIAQFKNEYLAPDDSDEFQGAMGALMDVLRSQK